MMKKILLTLFYIVVIIQTSHSQTLFINEICSNNYISYADSAGDNGDWIEIYNGGGSSVNTAGMYLTDNFTNLTKYQIPSTNATATTVAAGGRIIFWFDDKAYRGVTHVSAKLGGNGEELALVASDGTTIIDSLTFGKQIYDVTYGRMTDGSATWTYFPTPSPRAANSGVLYTGIAGNVVWSFDAGFYPSSIQVALTPPSGTATIYYSLNGNEPSPTRGILYTAPIQVDTNATIRVRVYDTNKIPGEIKTHSYFINRAHDLPVMCITTDSSYLWDLNIGMYCFGVDNYSHSFPYTGANFWADIKHPAHLELFEANDVQVIDQDLNLSISGNYSRAYAQKSFNLESKSALGNDHINYPVFPDLPITQYEAIKVRNGGQDWSSTTMRDAINHTMTEGFCGDMDHMAYRPVAIYLNGQYWGILNMTEKIDKDYLNEHWSYVDKDSIDLLELNASVVEGSATNYNSMISYITANTMTNQTNYNYVKTQMEVDNYINFVEMRIYWAATDWPQNNVKYWRPKNDPTKKWRWILWDTERSSWMSTVRDCELTNNTLNWATDHTGFSGTIPSWSTFLLKSLLLNNEFKTDFITQFANHINFTFCPQRVDSLIDAFRDRENFEMPNHINKWKDSNDTMVYYTQGYFKTMAKWYEEIDTMKLFYNNRAHYMRQFIMDKFLITDTSELVINKIPVDGGDVYVDSFVLPQNVCKMVYFNGYPITLTAHANSGYAFLGWISAGGDTLPLTWTPNGDTTVTAYFSATASEPTVAATNISSSVVNCNEVNLNWTNGNGASRVVVAKFGSAVNNFPADGNEYTASATFGSGDDLGGGNFVVYAGNGNACIVSGLVAGTQYYFAVIEYNGTLATANYNTTTYLTTNVTASTFSISASATLNAICENESTVLSATGGLTYVWSPSTGLSSTTDSIVTAILNTSVTYTVDATDAFGCHATTTISITVNPPPFVALSNQADMCEGSSAVTLHGGIPSGGTYSGNGVSSSTFDPVAAGVGTHDIIYFYTDINGCSNADTSTLTVNALPVVTQNNFSDVCADASPITLSGGNPVGGTYSGNGVSSGIFDAAVAGTGTQNILYTYTDGNNCTNTATATINVNPLPTVTQNFFSNVCVDTSPFQLTGGSPAGGTYSGNGVTAGIFDPSAAGVGTQIITYSFTDSAGCSNSATETLNVQGLPTVTQSAFNDVCADASPITLSGGNPTGGTYSGTGVTSGIFDPVAAGLGTQTITYTYTNATGCSDSAAITITVNDVPIVTLGSDTTICMYNNILLDAGSGFASYVWSTTETTQTIFVDSTGTGIGTATYNVTVSNAFNCTATDELNVTFDICAGIVSENISSPSVIVYPNPFSDEITIASDEINITITLYDVFGKIILKKKMSATTETIRPDVSAGIYFLRIEREKELIIVKVVKTR